MLEASRDSMLSFLDAISDASDVENEVWQPPSDCQGVEACNIMHMARTGEIGEVRLGLFSTGVAIEGRKSSQVKFEVAANPLALLRCDLEVQKRLLLALYVDRTSDA
jgi:hypothetical protein